MTKLSAGLVLALPLFCGCAAGSDAMGEIGYARPPQPRPGYAMVVFVRPSSFAAGDLYHVFSDRYGFLGDAHRGPAEHDLLPPGRRPLERP